MALSALADRSRPPDPRELEAVLGAAFPVWNELQALLPDLRPEWGFTAKSTGWGLRLKSGDRAILYMTPQDGRFLASFALGERAVEAARGAGLPPAVMDVIEGARRYAEGRGVRLTVTTADELPAVATLARIKLRS